MVCRSEFELRGAFIGSRGQRLSRSTEVDRFTPIGGSRSAEYNQIRVRYSERVFRRVIDTALKLGRGLVPVVLLGV